MYFWDHIRSSSPIRSMYTKQGGQYQNKRNFIPLKPINAYQNSRGFSYYAISCGNSCINPRLQLHRSCRPISGQNNEEKQENKNLSILCINFSTEVLHNEMTSKILKYPCYPGLSRKLRKAQSNPDNKVKHLKS